MGYGFVGFKTVEGAKKAITGMQGFVLDGHSLHVKFAGRGTEEESKEKMVSKSRTTKMIVKNVPFEATKKDIRELFGYVVSWVMGTESDFVQQCSRSSQIRPSS
jgi:multiple RNA-binding domain-containing protein 1